MPIAPVAIAVAIVTTAFFAAIAILHTSRLRLNVEQFITDRNALGPGVALGTAVASVAGAWILFSPAETGTWAGLAGLVGYGLGQAAPLAAFALIGPRMRRLMPEGHSLSEYAWHRFGAAMYLFVLAVMVFYMFIFLAAELTGIAQGLGLIADVPLLWTAGIVAVGTLAYTAYGGIKASIFTDNIQFLLIVPLVLIAFLTTIVALGGFGPAFAPVAERAPALLSLAHGPGIEFGIVLIIAILAANMFHQGFWQRVYACRDEAALRRGFFLGGLVVIPLIFVAGLFGIMAVGFGVPAEQASVALFTLVVQVLPTWALLLILVLALALVMSSMDSLLNGIASVVTSDLWRLRPQMRPGALLRLSRLTTVFVAIPAVMIAAQGHSVLYLFLIADLVCAGAVFPTFYGMYSRRLSGTGALVSSLLGILVGALFFPRPDFTPWLAIPFGGRFLVSFGSALVVSTIAAVLWSTLAGRLREPEYDFRRLAQAVRVIEEPREESLPR